MIAAPRSVHWSARLRLRPLVALVAFAALVALVAFVWPGGLTAHPADPGLWAGPAPGGAWAPTSLTVQANALIAEPGHPAVMFAGTYDGVWRCGDGGVHWTRAGRGLRAVAIVALAATAEGDTLFAGSEEGAVYVRGACGAMRRGAASGAACWARTTRSWPWVYQPGRGYTSRATPRAARGHGVRRVSLRAPVG